MTARDMALLVKDAGIKFWNDDGPRLGAAMAYYTALSLAPLLVAVVAIAGLAYGQEAARGEIVDRFQDTIGTEAAAYIEQLVIRSSSQTQGILASVAALVIVFIGATGVFAELQSAFNTIWKTPSRESSGGIFSVLKGRLLAFVLILGAAILLLASLVATTILAGINARAAGWFPGTDVLAEIANFLLNFALTTVLFAMMFKWLPEAQLAWRDVWIGAAATAALFSIGRYLIGLYLGQAAVASTFGAAGTFAVLLVWIYYSAQILLFGASLTFLYSQRYGSGVRANVQDGVASATTSPGFSPIAAP